MKEINLLEEMARIILEIHTTNLWTDDARANQIARIRHRKSMSRLTELLNTRKTQEKEEHPCTHHRSAKTTLKDSTG